METRDEEVGFLEEHAARLEQDRENLTGQLAELARQDVEQQTVRRAAVKEVGKRSSIQESVAKLLRPLELDEESIETLLDLPDSRATLRWLVRIANKEAIEIREGVHTKVKGYPGWWEVHKIHIGDKGNAAAGRIYYQREQDGCHVRIHRKEDEAEQRQYMKRALR